MIKLSTIVDAQKVMLDKQQESLFQLGLINENVVLVKGDTEEILAGGGGTPNEPPVSDDGYKGKLLGIYRIKPSATGATSFQPLNGDGGYSTPMQDRTVRWMETNCPGWDDFVHPAGSVKPAVVFTDGLWHIISKAVYGQLVRVAEIVNGRARIIGMDADGDPMYAAVNLDACSPTKTPYYFHKIQGVPRYFPMIQPRGKDRSGFAQCWWIDASMLEPVV